MEDSTIIVLSNIITVLKTVGEYNLDELLSISVAQLEGLEREYQRQVITDIYNLID